ncbi:MAG: hypothetical protein HKN82_20380, partial [Akkermansiaceae bacterium]|nr:hypothetical protein [Akkermansiaceae bacterium]
MLRQTRHLQGRTLRAVASATRIPVNVLEALERNKLPESLGNTYARSFLIQYASHLGVPLREFNGGLPAPDPFRVAGNDATVPTHSRIILAETGDPSTRRTARRDSGARGRPPARSRRTPGYSAVLVAIATGMILTSALRAYIGIEQSLGRADVAAPARTVPAPLAEF